MVSMSATPATIAPVSTQSICSQAHRRTTYLTGKARAVKDNLKNIVSEDTSVLLIILIVIKPVKSVGERGKE